MIERDFMEQSETLCNENGENINVFMRLCTAVDGPDFKKEAELTFVGPNGMHLSLVQIPWSSLKVLARFIKENVRDYEARVDL